MAGQITVHIDPVKVAEFLRSPNGPVLRSMIVLGDKVKERAVASMTGFPRDFLGPQIVKRVLVANGGPQVMVGAANPRTNPHVITGNPLLVFFWEKAGRVVAFPSVNHPGSDFSQYLTTTLTNALTSVRGEI